MSDGKVLVLCGASAALGAGVAAGGAWGMANDRDLFTGALLVVLGSVFAAAFTVIFVLVATGWLPDEDR